MASLDHLPLEIDIRCFHFFFQAILGVVVAHLPEEIAAACKFADRHCLISSLPAVGCKVLVGLNGLSNSRNFVDIEELVDVGAAQDTYLLISLHDTVIIKIIDK
jgi:hypothetical protein